MYDTGVFRLRDSPCYPEVCLDGGAALYSPGDVILEGQQVVQAVDEVVDPGEGEDGHQVP